MLQFAAHCPFPWFPRLRFRRGRVFLVVRRDFLSYRVSLSGVGRESSSPPLSAN